MAGIQPASAQDAKILGRIQDDQGGPLGGAQVVLRELSIGATTNAKGEYAVTVPAGQVRGQLVTLVARLFGRAPELRIVTLRPGEQRIDFTLHSDPLHLDELVVTGLSAETSTRKLPFAVGRVSADQLQDTPALTPLGGLQGKIAGVRILEPTGAPGAAPRIRLRGSTSLSGSQDPLIIIDGTITRATLADLASEDIERIEVVKGPAASSLYGSDAANGVVQVFTKRGRGLAEGKLLVTTRNELGVSFVTRRVTAANAHAYQIEPDPDRPGHIRFKRDPEGNRIAEPDGIADNPYPEYHDHQGEVLRPGQFLTNYVSIGRRQGGNNFNASFQNTHNAGVLRTIGAYSRQNVRLNVDQELTPRLSVELSSFYGRSSNPGPSEADAFFAPELLEPNVDILAKNDDGTPYRATLPEPGVGTSNPLYDWANFKRETNRNRYSAGARIRWRMLDWLTGEANYNYDLEQEDFSANTPFGFLAPNGTPTTGDLDKRATTGRTYNLGVTISATKVWQHLTNTTKASYIYEDQSASVLEAYAYQLSVKGVPEFSAANPASVNSGSWSSIIRNRNAYLVTSFDLKDRYILDALVRRDESSLFGPESRRSWYYRLSGAWRVNQDFPIPGVDELRLRASYGTAGLRPGFEYQYETLSLAGGGITKAQLGNRFLRPARSAEFEAGLNLELGRGRLSLEYTYARKTTKDQILLVDLPSVVGFTQQWRNAGALRAVSHELALGWQAINRKELAWTVTVTADRVRQVITDWPLPPVFELFNFRESGARLGVYYGHRFARRIDQLYDDPEKQAASGTNQAWSRDSVVVNEEGFVVRREVWRTPGERPLLYKRCVDAACSEVTERFEIGNANPDFTASFGTTLNYHRLSLSGLFDWVQGGNIYNLTRQTFFIENRDRVFDQSRKPELERKSQQYYNFFYDSRQAVDYFVEPGTYARVKELAVNYTLVRSQLRAVGLGRLENLRVGIVGRNLFTVTRYSGYDPEVAVAGVADPFQLRVDSFQYPNLRTFTAMVEIAF